MGTNINKHCQTESELSVTKAQKINYGSILLYTSFQY